nr:unnamed protein product [Spirometra erinaceieuropaei]
MISQCEEEQKNETAIYAANWIGAAKAKERLTCHMLRISANKTLYHFQRVHDIDIHSSVDGPTRPVLGLLRQQYDNSANAFTATSSKSPRRRPPPPVSNLRMQRCRPPPPPSSPQRLRQQHPPLPPPPPPAPTSSL